jgi:N-dimethylarginine dimethylaminohydrolase
VPGRMVHLSRQRRVPHYLDWYRRRGFKIIDVDLGADHLEGDGDLLRHSDRSRIYAGYGFRSTQGSVEKFREAMAKLEIRSLLSNSSTLTATTLVPASVG